MDGTKTQVNPNGNRVVATPDGVEVTYMATGGEVCVCVWGCVAGGGWGYVCMCAWVCVIACPCVCRQRERERERGRERRVFMYACVPRHIHPTVYYPWLQSHTTLSQLKYPPPPPSKNIPGFFKYLPLPLPTLECLEFVTYFFYFFLCFFGLQDELG